MTPVALSLRCALVLACFSAPSLLAHDSPEHVVELLSARIRERGKTAELLWQRATEQRALNHLAAAAADLREAISLQPAFIVAQADLGRVEFQLGDTPRALQTLTRAISDAGAAAPGLLHLARAEIRNAAGDFKGALADVEKAVEAGLPPDPDWYLLRSQIQLRLGRSLEAAAGLKEGLDRTGCAVLEADWIDALLDSRQAEPALTRIEAQLAETRCRSSWLIRRARARLLLGKATQARGDLHAAISEINGRLSPAHPDVSLLVDRGVAHALLGDLPTAQRELDAVRKAGGERQSTWRLEALLGSSKPGGPVP
ncbi:MAG: hypothetical protein QOF48_78 [Verrucomicrobiota bacterium]|jgi:tetratricopeptide (TPR) repeat protein